jgi:hypothetical protein
VIPTEGLSEASNPSFNPRQHKVAHKISQVTTPKYAVLGMKAIEIKTLSKRSK